MKIAVLQEHIDSGKRDSPGACPIALAMLAAGLSCPSVYRHFVEWHVGEVVKSARIDLMDFVTAFDSGGKVLPFVFEIS